MSYFYPGWAPYVPVRERKKQAAKKVTELRKQGKAVFPVEVKGREIALTFWGKAWCQHLEKYSDCSSRLERGRTYVRNGSVIDLQLVQGQLRALVSGSSIYKVEVDIAPLTQSQWTALIKKCMGQIHSVVELLQGQLSRGVMECVTQKKNGLFPSLKQISMRCSCPDDVTLCKHVAATLYGIGARLDSQPELLFELRKVNHSELITAAVSSSIRTKKPRSKKIFKSKNLSTLFGIEIKRKPAQNKPKKESR